MNMQKRSIEKCTKMEQFINGMQLSRLHVIMNKKEETNSSKFLYQIYKTLDTGISETFDLANFIRNKENYEEAINLYSKKFC